MDCQSVPNCKTDCQSVLLKEDHVEFKYLLLETTDGVATLTINRPEALNALNGAMLAELECAPQTSSTPTPRSRWSSLPAPAKRLSSRGPTSRKCAKCPRLRRMPLCGPVSG